MSTTQITRQAFARTDDGAQLFFRVLGQGEPALVCNNGLGVSTFFWEYLARHFAPERAVVLWDYRGHGRSSVLEPGDPLDVGLCARDLGTVMEAAGIKKAVLLGHSMGCQVALERYRQAPESIAGIVSILGTYGHPLDTFSDLPFSRQLFDVIIQLSESFPRTFDTTSKLLVSAPFSFEAGRLLKWVDGSRIAKHDLMQYMRHLVDIGFPRFFALAREMGEHTAADLLSEVRVPMLVVAGEFDAFTPAHLSEEMVQRIPDAQLVWLEGASHAGIVEQPEQINQSLAEFLERIES